MVRIVRFVFAQPGPDERLAGFCRMVEPSARMDDLVLDPIGTMSDVYSRLGWSFTDRAEAAMREWLAGNPRHGRGDHQPDATRYGLVPEAVHERFARYLHRFDREGRDE